MKRICAIAMAVTAALMARAQTEPVGGGAQPPVWETATEVHARMFEGHEDIMELRLTNVKKIDDRAFAGLTELESVYISAGGPDEMYFTIGYLFSEDGYANLKTIELLSAAVPFYPFASMPHYPYSLCSVPMFTGQNCPKLSQVIVPERCQYIGRGCFNGSTKLTEIELFELMSYIGTESFKECPNLRRIVLHVGMPPLIEWDAFDGIADDCEIVVPKGFGDVYRKSGWNTVGTIVESEEIECNYTPYDLPDITINSKFGYSTFADFFVTDEEAREVTMVASNYCVALDEDTGKPVIKAMPYENSYGCFLGVEYMEGGKPYVTDNQGVEYAITAIGRQAFTGMECQPTITLPELIRHIGRGAFERHPGLTTVRMRPIVPPVAEDETVFGDKSALTLEVPVGAAAAYRAAEVWRDFGNIVENAELGNSGVVSIDADLPAGSDTYYSIDGRQLTGRPAPGTIHIVRHADGSATLRR